jgi:type IV pilus assembly protein PilE
MLVIRKTRATVAGFTLIELMIALAVIGILAAVAYPSYIGVVTKSRREDAMAALMDIQLSQEKWRANHSSYTGDLRDIGWGAATNAVSRDGYYTLNVSGASATAYTATAAPKTGTPQANDSCSFTLNQNGPDLSTAAKKTCWGK